MYALSCVCSGCLKATRHPRVKVHKRYLYKHLPKISFSKWKLVIPGMAEEGISSCLYMTGSASLPQNSSINASARSFETVHGHVFIYAHSPPSLLSSGPRAKLSSQVSSQAIFKHSSYKSSEKGVSNGNADSDLKRQPGNYISVLHISFISCRSFSPSPSFSISVLWLINAQNLWNILTVEGNIWPPAQINIEKLQHPQPDIVTVPDGANVQLQVVMRKLKEEEHMQKSDHWKREKQQTCLTAFVFLYDIHDLSSLEADLRVLLLLIVGHHHILLQDHGFRTSISTWGREKASRKPASSHGSSRATSVHPIHDRPNCHQSQANQQTTLARSISPNGWPYRNSLLWPTTQQHRGTLERRRRKKGRGKKKYEEEPKTVS